MRQKSFIPKELGVKDFAELRSSYSTNVINELTQQVVKYLFYQYVYHLH